MEELCIYPSVAMFVGGEHQSVDCIIEVTNNSSQRLAVKMKTNDSTLFTVTPVYFFIEPSEMVKVRLIRKQVQEQTTKPNLRFGAEYALPPTDAEDAKTFWTENRVIETKQLIIPAHVFYEKSPGIGTTETIFEVSELEKSTTKEEQNKKTTAE